MNTRNHIAASLIVLLVTTASIVAGQQRDKLGKVEFPNSCSPAVQEKLLRGIAMLHSFYYSATQRAFEEVAAEDNSCAVAAWGYASILMSNPLQGIGASAKGAQQAQAAIDKGRQMGAKTQRERDYLEAVAAYYENFDSRTERERQLARAKAYEALAAKYPEDDEAQIFYALYLAGTQTASDQTYSAYRKAAAILEKQFAKHPDHPGVAHYLIHSYDAPPLCQHRARRTARTAHAFAHLHTRRRVGRFGGDQPPLGRRREAEQRSRRRLARARLHDLRVPAARPRRRRAHDLGRGSHAHDRHQSGARHRLLRPRGDAGALGRRARRLARSGRHRAEPKQLSLHGGNDAFRARARRGEEWRCGGGAEGCRADHRTARPAEGGEERVLGHRGGGD